MIKNLLRLIPFLLPVIVTILYIKGITPREDIRLLILVYVFSYFYFFYKYILNQENDRNDRNDRNHPNNIDRQMNRMENSTF